MTALADAIERVRAADVELRASNVKPFPLPVAGLEPVLAGSLLALQRGDWWVPGLRERVGAVLRDVPVDRLLDPAGARPYRVAPATASPALRALHAVGLALADRDRAALVHLGVGSAADGSFHEALNLAALLKPTVIFVVAVHPLTGDAPIGPQLAASPAALADAFGLPSARVDGRSADEVHAAVRSARERSGPALIEARLH